MTRYVLSPRAQADLEEIWDFTADHWGLTQAEAYIRQLQTSVATIAAVPALGRSCDEVRPGYRKYRTGSHIIFYRVMDDGIDVVRILHARMDFGRHL